MENEARGTELVAAEVCEILRVDRSTLVRWVQAGKLVPTRKLPGRTGAYLFDSAQVEARRVAGAAR